MKDRRLAIILTLALLTVVVVLVLGYAKLAADGRTDLLERIDALETAKAEILWRDYAKLEEEVAPAAALLMGVAVTEIETVKALPGEEAREALKRLVAEATDEDLEVLTEFVEVLERESLEASETLLEIE